jgi:hypothetical protein
MRPPPAELAANLFVEIQKYAVNGKMIMCDGFPAHSIIQVPHPSPSTSAVSQKSPPPLQPIPVQSSSRTPANMDLDSDGADGVDALPVSYKKKSAKNKARNAYHVSS